MTVAPSVEVEPGSADADTGSRMERFWPRFGVAALICVAPGAIVYLSFDNGGYFPNATAFTAIICAQALVLRTVLAERPFEGYSRGLAVALGALGLFALLQLASALWSHDDANALDQYDRTLLYLLALALFGSLGRSRLRLAWLTRAVAAAMAFVCIAGLLSRTLPHLWPTAASYFSDRLSYPLGYWNALGLMGAIATVLLVHLASSLSERWAVRVVAALLAPATATTMLLTYSRGALGVAILALVVYVVLGRPRGLPSALIVLAPTIAIALHSAYDAVLLSSTNPTSPAALVEGRHVALIVGICMVAAGLGRAALLPLDRWLERPHRLPEAVTRLPRRAVVVAVSVVLVVVLVVAGAPGYAKRQYDRFVGVNSGPVAAQVRDRLTDPASNGRDVLWTVAWHAFRGRPVLGQGAGSYDWYHAQHRTDNDDVTDAHSLYFQTLAEQGVVGFALLIVALLCMLIALAAGIRGPHRSLYAALFAAALAWTVHAGVDWDWQMPSITLWLFAVGGASLAAPVAARKGFGATPRNRVALALGWLVLAVAPLLVGFSYQRLRASGTDLANDNCPAARQQALSSISMLAVRPDAYEILGYCDLENGFPAQGLQAMKKAVSYERQNWNYHFGLAIALAENGLDPRQEATKALALNPREPLTQDLQGAFNADTPPEWLATARSAVVVGLNSGSLSVSNL